MNKKAFVTAVTELGDKIGVSRELIVSAIQEAFNFTLNKKLEDELRVVQRSVKPKKVKEKDKEEKINKEVPKIEPVKFRVACDLDNAKIDVFYQRNVLENDDDIQDDILEISLEEALKINKKIKAGDVLETPVSYDDFTKKDVDRFINNFKSNINRAEREALKASFASKINQIISGVVEKSDRRSVIVNLGKATATLNKSDLIGDEEFRNGDTIKVYLKDISNETKNGSLLIASRSCNEFLEKLFENEVSEIYDGTVIIKQIERIPGKRAKVAVYSTDENVDPTGACIGKNGDRIQKIVSQLGGGKEKIDVILYKESKGLYLAEILKPGEVVGVKFFDEDNKHKAIVICSNDSAKAAISAGTNVKLAKKMLKLDDIHILNDYEAQEKGIDDYRTIESYILEESEIEKQKIQKEFYDHSVAFVERRKQEDELLKQEENAPIIFDNDENLIEEIDDNLVPETEEIKEKKPVEVKINIDVPETKEVKEEIKEVLQPKKEEPVEHKDVQTTTTLELLEKSLEDEKNAKVQAKTSKKKFKKDTKKDENNVIDTSNTIKMDIYTKEELEEIDDDLVDDYDDSDDYSDYDSDDYYEE